MLDGIPRLPGGVGHASPRRWNDEKQERQEMDEGCGDAERGGPLTLIVWPVIWLAAGAIEQT